jgi:glycosyltransferase involved in cell wall biosynthesis
MSRDPLVSVVMIFLDAERFLAEAIESVRAQSYAHWELLLVDDGSSDGSSALARRYAAESPQQIRYLEHPGHENRGKSSSRNLGIREAKGEYITFLDADDVFLPRKLERQVATLRLHPEAAMCYGRALIWHGWTGRAEDVARDHGLPLGVPADALAMPPTLFHLLLDNRAQSPMIGNAILRRDVFGRVGGFEDSFRGLYEDQAFFFKVALRMPTYVSSECWMKYRQHPESCVARSDAGDYYAERRPLMEWLASYLAGEGVAPDSGVWKATRRELWRTRHPASQRWLGRLVSIPRRARRAALRALGSERRAGAGGGVSDREPG